MWSSPGLIDTFQGKIVTKGGGVYVKGEVYGRIQGRSGQTGNRAGL